MRTFLIATAAVMAMAATPARAQTFRHGGGNTGGSRGGGWVGGGGWSGGSSASASASASAQGGAGGWSGQRGGWNNGAWNGQHWGGGRWGGNIGNRWYGGVRAPGGWNSYRRPARGWAMPGYWRSPAWAINDWRFYGLQAPPAGYGWSRYYDDAVLLDERGYVYDSVGGLDWRRADQPYASGYGYPGQGYYNAPGGQYHGQDPRCYEVGRKRKGSGVGGAIVGGVIGAAVGAATGGLGTTLLAGGLGALGGQAIDRNSRRGEIVCDEPGYGSDVGYDPGPDYGAGEDAYAHSEDSYAYDGRHDRAIHGRPPAAVHYGYAPGVIATATVDFGAPVTTTTTTTTVTEEWIYPRATRKWKPRPKVRCTC